MENNLPGWQVLSSSEELIKKEKFISSLATFYIKSDFAVTNKRFIAHYPKIVLGILPMWFENITFNLKQISNVNIDVEYKIFKIILWIIAIIFWFWSWSAWVMLIWILLWILFFASWIQVYIKVATSWGVTFCPVVFFEKWKAKRFIQEINTIIAENT